MKQVSIILFTLLACAVMGACSSDDDVILGSPYPDPICIEDLNQTVHENDIIAIKSIVPSKMFSVRTKYNQEDQVSKVYFEKVQHHWLEAQQANDSTYIFHVCAKEATDTVTFMEVYINGLGPYGTNTITFHLVPPDSKGISGYSDSFRSE